MKQQVDFIAHEPGIYFGMPADEYHADPALGSSDIRSAMKSMRKYWLRSWRNPYRHLFIEPDKDASVFGTALHSYVLDGRQAFSAKYVRRPDDAPGATPAQKSAITRKANIDAEANGKISLHGDDWALCEGAMKIIQTHPDLVNVFSGSLHEVSIFWIDKETGVRLKMRGDILKPRGLGDIKTIANEGDLRLETAAKLHIKKFKYHIQAEHYMEGRRHLPTLFKQKRVWVHGLRAESQTAPVLTAYYQFLEACAGANTFAYQLIFISKAMPEVWGCHLSPGNPLLKIARERIDATLYRYTQYEEKFSNREEWPEEWKLGELDINELPGGEFGWD